LRSVRRVPAMARPQLHHQPRRLLSPGMQRIGLACVLAATTFWVYAPVRTHPFITIDDYGYVVNNFHIQYLNFDTVKWSFTTFHYSNWDPLTWLSHAVDWHFYGRNAGGHHLTSLLMHALSVVLLFWMLAQATGYLGRSFAVAGLFALHPVNVEPVAWVAERKTVLSMVFFLLTLIAYDWYAKRPAWAEVPNTHRVRVCWTGVLRYIVVAALFALGLLSKPQVITLPFVLLLWDYWPLERTAIRHWPFAIRREGANRSSPLAFGQKNDASISGQEPMANGEERDSGAWRMANVEQRPFGEWRFSWLLLEKVPLLALSAGSALLTMKAQWANRTLGGLNTYTFTQRAGNAIIGYTRYLRHAVWPANLSFFYPHAHSAPPFWRIAAASLLLIVITVLALADRKHRYLAVGWLWFLGTFLPMIQFVQVGNHAMADRYAYVPFLGLFIGVTWRVADWAEQWRASRILLPVGTVAVLLLLAVATRRQLSYWTDDLALWTHSAQAVSNNAMAENMIGETWLQRRQPELAIAHFRTAATMDPLFPFPHLHIGVYEEQHGNPREAIAQFQQVITLTDSAADHMPALRANAFAHMSFAYNQLGDYAKQEKYLSLAAQQQQQ
jgi:protein O-mannosyl-transferase